MSNSRESGRNITAPDKTNKNWLTGSQSREISRELKGQDQLIFQILVATGQRFSRINNLKWESFNARMRTLTFGSVTCRIAKSTADGLAKMRADADGEGSRIFNTTYKPVWNRTSRVYFKVGIDQAIGCIRRARLTFARRHYLVYRDKCRLAQAMGIRSTRWIDKSLFEVSGPPPCLIIF